MDTKVSTKNNLHNINKSLHNTWQGFFLGQELLLLLLNIIFIINLQVIKFLHVRWSEWAPFEYVN
jgi:hypothetical protein